MSTKTHRAVPTSCLVSSRNQPAVYAEASAIDPAADEIETWLDHVLSGVLRVSPQAVPLD